MLKKYNSPPLQALIFMHNNPMELLCKFVCFVTIITQRPLDTTKVHIFSIQVRSSLVFVRCLLIFADDNEIVQKKYTINPCECISSCITIP